MVKKPFNIRLDDKLLRAAQVRAAQAEISVTQLIEDGLALLTEFDWWTYERICSLSRQMKIPASAILGQCFVRALVEADAHKETYGISAGPLSEILLTDQGPYPCDLLYQSEMENRTKQLDREKFEILFADYQSQPDTMNQKDREFVEKKLAENTQAAGAAEKRAGK